MSDIHPTALVDKKAKIGTDVCVGPYSIVGPNVVLDDGVRIENHVSISGHTTLSKNVHIFAGAIVGGIPQDLKYRGEPTTLSVGENTVIRECATVHIGTELGGGKTVIGSDNLIMAYVHVAHDCVLGNKIVIANATQLAGHVHIEDGARLAGLVGVHHFVRIGMCSFVAGCAKLSIDVPPFTLAEGHPAGIRALNREGLKRRGMTEEAQAMLKETYRLCFRSDLSQEQAIAEVVARGCDKVIEVSMFLEFIKASARGKYGRALESEREVVPAEERDGRLGFTLPSGQFPATPA